MCAAGCGAPVFSPGVSGESGDRNRPVPRSDDSGPLPLLYVSVVIRLKSRMESPGRKTEKRSSSWHDDNTLTRNFGDSCSYWPIQECENAEL
jgi:hypothetical protein